MVAAVASAKADIVVVTVIVAVIIAAANIRNFVAVNYMVFLIFKSFLPFKVFFYFIFAAYSTKTKAASGYCLTIFLSF